jgi:hypothetical protein
VPTPLAVPRLRPPLPEQAKPASEPEAPLPDGQRVPQS